MIEHIAETERLLIRNWTLDDTDSLMALSREPGFSDFSVTGYKDFSKQRATDWINCEIGRYERLKLGKFACTLKATGEIIGITGIFERYRERDPQNMNLIKVQQIEINYRFPQKHQGKGYATEGARAILKYGFEKLNLNEIHAFADNANFKSQEVLERLGMKRIGDTEYSGIKAGHWRLARESFQR